MIDSLEQYDFPKDLKTMSFAEMDLLAIKIREFLIENISRTGGHLASNLGVVELTIALHRLLDPPQDKIVWDVGHQSYVHKILTGRAGGFERLRMLGGISGFPRSEESLFDAFDTGHSSTSVSVVAGMAAARDLHGESYETVAVIGDGSLTGGLSYEALNNLGVSKSKAIIIINDNGMSIRKNTGGLSSHLGKLRMSKGYKGFKKKLGETVKNIPGIGDGVFNGLEKVRDTLKYAIVDGVIFEELGFKYLGPIDGHNIEELMENLSLAKACDGPIVMHVITQKGKGYRSAELNPDRFHGTGPFDRETGVPLKKKASPTYSDVFGNKLIEMAEKDDRIVAISAAMTDGTGLTGFEKSFPDRTFDVGIAEGHAVTFAGGLAASGMRPFVAVYSAFLQRGFDEIVTDVCLQNLPVVFAIDRAGIVGPDGETHHGIMDISYMSQMPGMTVMAPRDGRELTEMMDYALSLGTPCSIRYPRGENGDMDLERIPVSYGAEVLTEGRDVEIWAVGSMVKTAAETAGRLKEAGIDAGFINGRFIKPIDREKLMQSADRTKLIVTLEDNAIAGGFGEKISLCLCGSNKQAEAVNFGWPDRFIEHGTCSELYDKYGLTPEKLTERILKIIERKA